MRIAIYRLLQSCFTNQLRSLVSRNFQGHAQKRLRWAYWFCGSRKTWITLVDKHHQVDIENHEELILHDWEAKIQKKKSKKKIVVFLTLANNGTIQMSLKNKIKQNKRQQQQRKELWMKSKWKNICSKIQAYDVIYKAQNHLVWTQRAYTGDKEDGKEHSFLTYRNTILLLLFALINLDYFISQVKKNEKNPLSPSCCFVICNVQIVESTHSSRA